MAVVSRVFFCGWLPLGCCFSGCLFRDCLRGNFCCFGLSIFFVFLDAILFVPFLAHFAAVVVFVLVIAIAVVPVSGVAAAAVPLLILLLLSLLLSLLLPLWSFS